METRKITEADTRLAPNYGIISYDNQLRAKEFDFRGRGELLQKSYEDIFRADDQNIESGEVMRTGAYEGIKRMERTEGYRNKTKFSFGYDGDSIDIVNYGLTEADIRDGKMDLIHPDYLKLGFISGEHPATYIVDPISVTTNELHTQIAKSVEEVVKQTDLLPFASPPRIKKPRSHLRRENRIRKQLNAARAEGRDIDLSEYSEDMVRYIESPTVSHHGVWKYLTVRTTDDKDHQSSMVILTNFVRYIRDDNRAEYERVIDRTSQVLMEMGVDIFVVTEYHVSLEPQFDDPVRIIFDRTNEGGVIDHLDRVRFKVSPFSFFQINNEGALQMYDTVFDMIIESNPDLSDLNDTILFDLYCGTGTIGIYLECKGRERFDNSQCFSEVIGIDCVQSSIDDAGSNAQLNGVSNAQFITGRCEEKIDILRDALLPKTSDNSDAISSNNQRRLQIVVDPSREGVNKKVIRFLAELVLGVHGITIDNMIYCSCNVHSWMNDIIRLQKEILRKWKKLETGTKQPRVVVDRVITLDMFPHTNHYEVVSKIVFE